MDYSISNIMIKDKWFEGKDNKYKAIGHEGLYLYLTLFRFYIGEQKDFGKYTFSTTIGMLRKETGYPAKRIDELIRLLVRYGVIKTNISRWADYMYVGEKIIADKHFIAYSTDHPSVERIGGVHYPISDEDFYTSINLELMQLYKDKELHERYYGLHCLLKKLSKSTQNKSWMSIEKMAEILDLSSNTLNKMVHVLNEEMLLATYFKESDNNKMRIVNGKKVKGKSSEHYLLFKLRDQADFFRTHGEQIQKNKSEWSKSEPQNAN